MTFVEWEIFFIQRIDEAQEGGAMTGKYFDVPCASSILSIVLDTL